MQEPVLGSFYLVYHVRLAAKNMTRHTKRQKKKKKQNNNYYYNKNPHRLKR